MHVKNHQQGIGSCDLTSDLMPNYEHKKSLCRAGLGIQKWEGVGEIGIHVIMNGQIKQRCREVWLFTSMGNFSHQGQTVELGAKNVRQRIDKFHQLFIKGGKKSILVIFYSDDCILELIIAGGNIEERKMSRLVLSDEWESITPCNLVGN